MLSPSVTLNKQTRKIDSSLTVFHLYEKLARERMKQKCSWTGQESNKHDVPHLSENSRDYSWKKTWTTILFSQETSLLLFQINARCSRAKRTLLTVRAGTSIRTIITSGRLSPRILSSVLVEIRGRALPSATHS